MMTHGTANSAVVVTVIGSSDVDLKLGGVEWLQCGWAPLRCWW